MMTTAKTSMAKRLGQISLIVVGSWLAGLVLFAILVPTIRHSADLAPADGIVVLTGGGGRLEAGLTLLTEKKGRRLLISGVHQAVAEHELAALTNRPDTLFDCCVDLDRASVNTVDNAQKTAEWARAHDFQSLYLVTADYHMRRSILLLERNLPDCEILPYPVTSNISVQGMVIEYSKFIVTYARTVLSV